MKEPDPDPKIQPLPNPVPRAGTSGGADDQPRADDALQPGKPGPRILSPGMLFGGFVGLLMGALVGGACCWLALVTEFLWQGALIGAMIGSLGGAIIGVKERKARGDFGRPDIATIICVVYGLVPAILILLLGIGLVRGSFSGYLFLGAISGGPMVGLLLGAILDRAYEASLQKSWGAALGFGVAGVTAYSGIAFVIVTAPAGPDTKVLAAEARSLILREWQKKPELRGATIQNVTLVHKGGKLYTGFVDATIGGQAERLSVEVIVEGGTLELTLKPMNE